MPKINQLTRASQIADTDLIPKENAAGTSTEAATAAQLAEYFRGKGVQVDNTLSTPGAAADAAKTGAEVTDLKKANAYDIFAGTISGVNRTYNGITFQWTDKTTCHISGTATAESFSNILVDTTSFPSGVIAGNSYYVRISGNQTGVVLRLALQPTTLSPRIFNYSENGIITIPANATGLTGRINVASGTAIPTGGINVKIALMNTLSNQDLTSEIDALTPQIADLEHRYLTSSEVSALNTLLDVPVNKCFSANGARILELDPSCPMSLRTGYTYFVECYEYAVSYKWFDVFTVDGLEHYTAWTATSHPTTLTWANQSRQKYKVLVFGNSSTYSVMGYMPAVWKELCPNVDLTFGLLYSSGQSLDGHLTMFNNGTAYPVYSEISTGNWANYANSITGKAALDRYKWDLIVIQQSNDYLMTGEDKNGIDSLCAAIANYLSYPIKFAINMPMSRGANSSSLSDYYPDIDDAEARSDAAFKDIAAYCEDSLNYSYISDVIPCGAAIQNARKTNLRQYGVKEFLCYDDVGHLQNGIGVLCASYAAALKLAEMSGNPAYGRAFANTLSPNDTWLNTYNLYTKTSHGTCVGVTDANKLIAARCAQQAIKFPYAITTLSPLKWVAGSIRADDGIDSDTSNTIRIRTSNYIKVDPSVNVILKNNSNVALRLYSSNYTFVRITASWQTTDFNLSTAISQSSPPSQVSYVRLMARYSDDRIITDVDALADDVIVTGL